jgi:hypothetical protein
VDGLIEIHVRGYERIRREMNREFVSMSLEGIPVIEYGEAKKQLKGAVTKIWDMDQKDLFEIISESAGAVKNINKLERLDLYVTATGLALEVGGMALFGSTVCPQCTPVLVGASIAIVVGWFIYQRIINDRQAEMEMITAQQKFMKNIREQLEAISHKTKEEFRASSDATYKNLIDIISGIIIRHYPQIKKENLV